MGWLVSTLCAARTGDVSDRGATAVEYGLMVAAITAVVAVAVIALGVPLEEIFTDVDTRFP